MQPPRSQTQVSSGTSQRGALVIFSVTHFGHVGMHEAAAAAVAVAVAAVLAGGD